MWRMVRTAQCNGGFAGSPAPWEHRTSAFSQTPPGRRGITALQAATRRNADLYREEHREEGDKEGRSEEEGKEEYSEMVKCEIING